MLAWSGRSPHLIVLDFLLWDYVKNVVCQETFSDLETLWHCITGNCSSDQKCAQEQVEGVGVRYLWGIWPPKGILNFFHLEMAGKVRTYHGCCVDRSFVCISI